MVSKLARCSRKSQTPGNRKPPLSFNRAGTGARDFEQTLIVLFSMAQWITHWAFVLDYSNGTRSSLAVRYFISSGIYVFLNCIWYYYVKVEMSLLHNANAKIKSKINRKQIYTGVFPYVRMQTATMTKWIVACSDQSKYTESLQSSTCYMLRGNYAGPLIKRGFAIS